MGLGSDVGVIAGIPSAVQRLAHAAQRLGRLGGYCVVLAFPCRVPYLTLRILDPRIGRGLYIFLSLKWLEPPTFCRGFGPDCRAEFLQPLCLFLSHMFSTYPPFTWPLH